MGALAVTPMAGIPSGRHLANRTHGLLLQSETCDDCIEWILKINEGVAVKAATHHRGKENAWIGLNAYSLRELKKIPFINMDNWNLLSRYPVVK